MMQNASEMQFLSIYYAKKKTNKSPNFFLIFLDYDSNIKMKIPFLKKSRIVKPLNELRSTFRESFI